MKEQTELKHTKITHTFNQIVCYKDGGACGGEKGAYISTADPRFLDYKTKEVEAIIYDGEEFEDLRVYVG